MNNQTKTEREGTFGSSVLVLALAIAVLLTGVVGFKLDPHIPLLFSSSIILLYGVWLRVPWKDMRDSIIKSISESIEAILIICLIGMTVGSWISSGTVPMVIYYGLKIFSPQFFLISVLVLCSIMSIMTGSSWTTIGTISVAFMGVGYGLGIPMGITAGAIICGAFFGDKQSPLSDSTNFAAAVAKTDLYDHVRSMIYTTGPAWLVSAVFFLFVGFSYSGGTADASQVDVITEGLAGAFNLNPVLLIPPVLLVVLIIKKFPAIPTMIIAAMMGMVLTVTVQGASLPDALRYMHSGFVGDTGVAVNPTTGYTREKAAALVNEMSAAYGLDIAAAPEDIDIIYADAAHDYAGPGYNVPDAKTRGAVELLARTEGIFLDPCYTAKSFRGFCDIARELDGGAIFVHTGGTPALWTQEHLDAFAADYWN